MANPNLKGPQTLNTMRFDRPAGSVWLLLGECLLDQPQNQLTLPETLPGSSYSLHRQCELAFGSGSRPCPYMHPCTKLWCTGKARGQLVCQTRHFPWADGTSCGTSRVCYRGGCVDKNNTVHIKVSVRRWENPHAHEEMGGSSQHFESSEIKHKYTSNTWCQLA